MHRQYDTLLVERDNNFIVIAYYTKDTPYEKEVEPFTRCCEKLNLNYYILGYRSRGSWERNAAIKPEFISDCLGIFPKRKLVYVDIDARIQSFPELFKSIDADIGVHYKDGQLLSGTIFLNGTTGCRELVYQWIAEQKKNPEEWDQQVLQRVLKGYGSIYKLPSSYTHIFDKMEGTPVIEHMQASRRYKYKVGDTVEIPNVVCGIRVQRSVDGTYWIARRNREAEAYLDANCIRQPGELRWSPKLEVFEDWLKLKPQFEGKILTIVGKGPSLDNLTAEDLGEGPVIALNEAIFPVEELGIEAYGLQQDNTLKNSCWPVYSGIFVSSNAKNWYKGHPEAYIFNGVQLGLSINGLSVSAAIEIGKRLGVTGFRLVCFDACVNGDTRYAKCVGSEPERGGHRDRFLKHRAKILSRCVGYDVEWVIPQKTGDIADDTLQLSPDNLEEHHEPDHMEPSVPLPATSDYTLRTEPSPHEKQHDHLENLLQSLYPDSDNENTHHTEQDSTTFE